MASTARLDSTQVGPADVKRSLPVRHVQSEVPNHDQSRPRCCHDRQRQSHRLSLWLIFAEGNLLTPFSIGILYGRNLRCRPMSMPDPGSSRPRRSRLSTVLITLALLNGLLGLNLQTGEWP